MKNIFHWVRTKHAYLVIQLWNDWSIVPCLKNRINKSAARVLPLMP